MILWLLISYHCRSFHGIPILEILSWKITYKLIVREVDDAQLGKPEIGVPAPYCTMESVGSQNENL